LRCRVAVVHPVAVFFSVDGGGVKVMDITKAASRGAVVNEPVMTDTYLGGSGGVCAREVHVNSTRPEAHTRDSSVCGNCNAAVADQGRGLPTIVGEVILLSHDACSGAAHVNTRDGAIPDINTVEFRVGSAVGANPPTATVDYRIIHGEIASYIILSNAIGTGSGLYRTRNVIHIQTA
jgi:hypothetical protein